MLGELPGDPGEPAPSTSGVPPPATPKKGKGEYLGGGCPHTKRDPNAVKSNPNACGNCKNFFHTGPKKKTTPVKMYTKDEALRMLASPTRPAQEEEQLADDDVVEIQTVGQMRAEGYRDSEIRVVMKAFAKQFEQSRVMEKKEKAKALGKGEGKPVSKKEKALRGQKRKK